MPTLQLSRLCDIPCDDIQSDWDHYILLVRTKKGVQWCKVKSRKSPSEKRASIQRPPLPVLAHSHKNNKNCALPTPSVVLSFKHSKRTVEIWSGAPASCSMFNSKSLSPYLNPPFPISSHLSTLPLLFHSVLPFIIVFLFALINHHLPFLSLKRNDGVTQEGERDPGLLGQARRAGRAIRRSLTHTSL